MARKRRKARTKRQSRWLAEELAVLRGEPCPEGGNPFAHLELNHGDVEELAAAWEQWGDDLVAEWIKKRPGTRPVGFWAFWEFAPPVVIEGVAPSQIESWGRKAAWTHRLHRGPPSEEKQLRLLRDRDLLGPEELKAIQATMPGQ